MKRDIVKLRKWCINKRQQGWPVVKICAHAQIPRRTFYNWLRSYETEGKEGLLNKSRKPNTIHRTSDNVVQKVLDIHNQHGWDERTIQSV